MTITMTTLPHLIFATELLEALALLPAPAEQVSEASKWGVAEWAALGAWVAALSALAGAAATCIIARTALKARNEWDNNTKKQARYDIEKLFTADVLPVMVSIESQAKKAQKIARKFSSDQIQTFSIDRNDYYALVLKIDSYFEFLHSNLREAYALLKAAKEDWSSIRGLRPYGELVTTLNFNLDSLKQTNKAVVQHIHIWEQIIEKAELFCDEYQIPSEVLGFEAAARRQANKLSETAEGALRNAN